MKLPITIWIDVVAANLAALSVRYYTDAGILLASHEPDRCARWYKLRYLARRRDDTRSHERELTT